MKPPPWVYEPATYLQWYLQTFARMDAPAKWKFDTVRCYVTFGWHQFHSITHPGYAFSRYPRWLWWLDCTVGSQLIRLLGKLPDKFHEFMYRRAYKHVLRKWPEHRAAILSGMDYPELIKEELTNAESNYLIRR
jgi:hypothetical protein